MAERFEKTYISVHEFVNSWEKEIYELTNLDYFIYLLINELGYQIEHEFLSKRNRTPYLRLELEEIGTLSFNIGDSFESFLENNCFGNCSLSCPTNLNDKISPDEADINDSQFYLIHILSGLDWDKRQYLQTDILNYVVLDTLFDFYNYEIGLEIDDNDIGLLQFADFITDILEKLVETKGQQYLLNPSDSASYLFDKLLNEADSEWESDNDFSGDDDMEESEMWKVVPSGILSVIQEFLSEMNSGNSAIEHADKLLHYYHDYCENYAGINKMDEFHNEDLEEFFSFWLVRELTLDNQISIAAVNEIFSGFFRWLELTKDLDIITAFENFMRNHRNEIEKTLQFARQYFEKHSVVESILENNLENSRLISGIFAVENISKNGLVRCKDIHLHKDYLNVQINLPGNLKMIPGIVIDGTLKPTLYGWRLVNLEYVYPRVARPYLH